jgi:hypothetical protein
VRFNHGFIGMNFMMSRIGLIALLWLAAAPAPSATPGAPLCSISGTCCSTALEIVCTGGVGAQIIDTQNSYYNAGAAKYESWFKIKVPAGKSYIITLNGNVHELVLANANCSPIIASPAKITHTVINDTAGEKVYTFRGHWHDYTGASVSVDCGLPIIQFTATSYAQAEPTSGHATVNVSVQMSRPTGAVVSVPFSVSINGPTNPGPSPDYTLVNPSLTFGPSDPLTKVIAIRVNSDDFVESTEQISIRLQPPAAGALLGTSTVATITVADSDGVSTIGHASGSDVAVQENAQQIQATLGRTELSVVLNKQRDTPTTVNYTVSGSAKLISETANKVSDWNGANTNARWYWVNYTTAQHTTINNLAHSVFGGQAQHYRVNSKASNQPCVPSYKIASDFTMAGNTRYRLTFFAKASSERNVFVQIKQANGMGPAFPHPSDHDGFSAPLTTSWIMSLPPFPPFLQTLIFDGRSGTPLLLHLIYIWTASISKRPQSTQNRRTSMERLQGRSPFRPLPPGPRFLCMFWMTPTKKGISCQPLC